MWTKRKEEMKEVKAQDAVDIDPGTIGRLKLLISSQMAALCLNDTIHRIATIVTEQLDTTIRRR